MKKYLLLWLIPFIGAVNATPISINNAGFEDNLLAEEGFTTSASGWSISGNAGTFNPSTISMPGGTAPEGINVAFAGGGSLTQLLSELLTENIQYTLSVDVIERLNLDITDYTIQLLAGGSVIAEDVSSLDPGNGNFLVSNLEYSALAGDLLLGSQLSIVLSAGSQQVNFDDVILDASSISAVPAPAAIWLLGSGLIGLIGMKKKSAKLSSNYA